MSIEAIAWALRVPVGGNMKIMLLGLANHAHPDGSESYPSLDTLASYGACDRSTARRNVRQLVEVGLVAEDGKGPKGQTKYRLQIGGGKLPRVANSAGGVAPVQPEPSIEPSIEEPSIEGPPQPSLLPDPVQETWDLYVRLLNRPRARLQAKQRKWIADAHRACGVERSRQAIMGLAASTHHRENGYIGLEYALVPKQGQSIESRVEMMAARVGATPTKDGTTVEALIGHLSSDGQRMVRGWMRDVEAWVRNRDNPGVALTGESSLRQVRERAKLTPIIEGNEIVRWERTDASS